jgi:3',5'-cyclic AMP phosphodiesterase CpdA
LTRIAHLTDLHFGAEDPLVVAALIAEIRADAPDLVAISGDLTQNAHRSEFRAARAFIDRLEAPSLVVPGNHDLTPHKLWERFTDPYARWRAAIALETEPVWQDDQVAVFGLNSAQRLGLHWDWSRGQVTHRRLARLIARIDALPPTLTKIVVTHHPLLPPEGEPRTPVAGGASTALAAFATHGVRLVLAGHLHRGYARLASPGGKPPLILQGATATSVRLRGEPNAYNRVTIGGGETAVEVRMWDGRAWTTRAEPATTLTADERVLQQAGLSPAR